MDSISAAEAAARLGTSIPRVMRAAGRLGMRTAPGRLSLTRAQYRKLRDELGATPRIAGLTATDVKVLAALRRAPLGMVSARAVASRAGISPTAASRALGRLERRGLVYREGATLSLGRARRVELWHANVLHPEWSDIAASLDEVRPPRPRPASRASGGDRVPARLRHLFWNVDPAQLDIARAGPFVARRILREEDPEGLAWGALHLKSSDWRRAALARGLDPRTRRLAENLARHGRR
jgi:DNA-binding transcriptional ArsR family regulator